MFSFSSDYAHYDFFSSEYFELSNKKQPNYKIVIFQPQKENGNCEEKKELKKNENIKGVDVRNK